MSGTEDGLASLSFSALRLADRAVVGDVECEGTRVDDGAPQPVYDISAMFDPNEHSPEFIDMASEGIAYGIGRGLFELLPGAPMCVRLLRRRLHDNPN